MRSIALQFGLPVMSVVLFTAPLASGRPEAVTESARKLPLAYDVDVAVVGGGTGAVAAAVAAATAGARVFLAAPRPYLGEDLCAPFRLWLESGEQPRSDLEKELFADSKTERGLRFAYRADRPSAERHPDSDPPSVLTDGRWATAFTESVQYDGDVTIMADLGKPRALREARLYFFQGNHDYEVDRLILSTSDDGRKWTETAQLRNSELGKGSWVEKALMLQSPLRVTARYVKFDVRKGPTARRMLLGEIQLFPRTAEQKTDSRPLAIPPMQIKRVLEQALVKAGVKFLYSGTKQLSLCILHVGGHPRIRDSNLKLVQNSCPWYKTAVPMYSRGTKQRTKQLSLCIPECSGILPDLTFWRQKCGVRSSLTPRKSTRTSPVSLGWTATSLPWGAPTTAVPRRSSSKNWRCSEEGRGRV